jgi:uncharacterized membrane protein YjjP (DUF1212 family)
MNTHRINNFRMAAYAALAAGLINLRYQTGAEANLSKSLVLIIPGALLFAAACYFSIALFCKSLTLCCSKANL